MKAGLQKQSLVNSAHPFLQFYRLVDKLEYCGFGIVAIMIEVEYNCCAATYV